MMISSTRLLDDIARKGADKEALANRAMDDPDLISVLLDGMSAPKASVKFGCEKVLRLVAEKRPDLIYPYFDRIAAFLDGDNKILKWGATITISLLAPVDIEKRFDALFQKYFSPITGPELITAANAIGGGGRIAAARPGLAPRIAREILKVERATYKTPECRNVAIGAAIEAFGCFIDHLADPKMALAFVRRQLSNTRKSTAKKAENLLRRFEGQTPSDKRKTGKAK